MWDKPFIKKLIKLSLPIMLQQLFIALGGIITTLMTGQLGDQPMAASSLANQLFFLLTLAKFGVSSGCAIYTAQYWGCGDTRSVLKTTGVTLLLGLGAGTFFMLIAVFLPHVFLGLFTSDAQVIALGVRFLRIVAASYLFTPVISAYSYILRSTGNARLPMLVSVSGVVINTVLGYGLVFGRLGLPQMGLFGAATANLTARVSECLLLVGMVYWLKTPLAASLRQLFDLDRAFVKHILSRALPVIFNELTWALGISLINALYARLGTQAVAALAIKESAEHLLLVPFIGLANACAILVGHAIGAGMKEKAASFVRQTLTISLALGAMLGTALFLGRPLIVGLYEISPQTQLASLNLLAVFAGVLWLRASNVVLVVGMLRGGGDTRFTYAVDSGSVWGLGVPLALLGVLVLHLPVHLVFLMVMAHELVRFAAPLVRFRSRRWIHNVVDR